jgi:hypothetical protein
MYNLYQGFSNFVSWNPGVPSNTGDVLGVLYCCLSYFQQLTSEIMLNYEYEVIFKNCLLNFQREFFGKRQVPEVNLFKVSKGVQHPKKKDLRRITVNTANLLI